MTKRKYEDSEKRLWSPPGNHLEQWDPLQVQFPWEKETSFRQITALKESHQSTWAGGFGEKTVIRLPTSRPHEFPCLASAARSLHVRTFLKALTVMCQKWYKIASSFPVTSLASYRNIVDFRGGGAAWESFDSNSQCWAWLEGNHVLAI